MLQWVSMTTTSAASIARRAEQLAPSLKALGDPHRLTIVMLLAEEPMTVKALQDTLGLGQTLVSHHIGILRRAGLVRAEPQGRSNVYELCCDALVEPVRTVAALAGDAG